MVDKRLQHTPSSGAKIDTKCFFCITKGQALTHQRAKEQEMLFYAGNSNGRKDVTLRYYTYSMYFWNEKSRSMTRRCKKHLLKTQLKHTKRKQNTQFSKGAMISPANLAVSILLRFPSCRNKFPHLKTLFSKQRDPQKKHNFYFYRC